MTTTDRSGIPTIYRSTRFRSRLEARWAVFFDLIRWRWTYEPFDADGYIPDFLIHGAQPILVEVGPCVSLASYIDKSTKAVERAKVLGHDLLVVGVSPAADFSSTLGPFPTNPTAGLFGELCQEPDAGAVFGWNAGLWGECFRCGSVGIVHSELSYVLRPCGHHQSGGFGRNVSVDWLEALWARAGNETQWLARRPESVADVLARLVLR